VGGGVLFPIEEGSGFLQ